jgi:UPF0755 protein
MRKAILVTVLVAAASAAGVIYLQQELERPVREGAPATALILEIPRGLGAMQIAGFLEDKGVIRNRFIALAYVVYSGNRNRLQAGEYRFDSSMTVPQIVHKLAAGDVYLHRFTVPEGLTIEETARKWAEQGFGSAEEFLRAAAEKVDLIHSLDHKATSLEGYLFPETYSFAAHTTVGEAIEVMIERFRQIVFRLQEQVPEASWPLDLHDTVVLASLIEAEAVHPDERPLIGSVFLNRLKRRILLQCDPTVIYALERADRYRGALTLADLRFDSPYNTYLKPGLPPGPIGNPGFASLLAAVQPAVTDYLYFVRTDAGRHTFSQTLAMHNRAVAAYRRSIKQIRPKLSAGASGTRP